MESASAKDVRLVEIQEDSSSLDDSPIADDLQSSRKYQETSSANDVSRCPIDGAPPEDLPNQTIIKPINSSLEVTTRLGVDEKDSTIVTKESPGIPESSAELGEPLVIPFDPENPESSRTSSQLLDETNGIVDQCENSEKAYGDAFNVDDNPTTSSSESTPSRKRPAGEFPPINAEIKRIGVEISEEHAQQLKNDIRRLSPVLVSLRERTLGEISLTSDSGLFEDEAQPPRIEESEERLAGESTESLHPTGDTSVAILSEVSLSRINETVYDPLAGKSNQESTNHRTDPPKTCTDPSDAGEVKENATTVSSAEIRPPNDHLDAVDPSRSSQDCVIQEIIVSPLAISCSPMNARPNVQRELMIVLSRVDDHGAESKNKSDQELHNQRTDCVVDGTKIDVDRTLTCVVDEASIPGNSVVLGSVENAEVETSRRLETVKSDDKIKDSSRKENPFIAGAFCLSPKYLGNDQLSRKSPKVVIERTLETPTSSSSSTKVQLEGVIDRRESLQRLNLDCVRKTLADSLMDDHDEDEIPVDPLAIGADSLRLESPDVATEVTSDLQESLDTETETETVSDSSELTSMTSVNLSDCVEPINGSSSCQETDSLPSDEVPGDMMTRLEPERPEAFTEDSAESLALATGARDEVRSDGSDSGLGSEIPGDPGPAPAPESDSETSFLDRIPDDILTDKDKVVNPLEAFVPDAGTSGTQQPQQQQQQQQQIPLPSFPSPPKSSLKRRLTDCMEGEPSPKRMNTEDTRKKRNIQFDAVTVYYFPRAQGFTCVPSQGGSTLGMSATHTHAERFSLAEHATEQRRIHRARLAQLRSERAANCVTEAASSSEDPSDDTDEEPSDTEELDIDSYYFLQPVPTWQRRALLRAAGVRRIDAVEKDDCRDIRASREHCGCGCKGYCDPESCPCSRANVKCQVDRAGFPCGCSRDGCANSSGRIEFNPVRVRTHFIHTLMRLQLEKKQRDEDRTDHDLLSPIQSARGPMREVPGLMTNPMDHPNVIPGDQVSCINAGGFTTLHYENHETASTSCQPIVHAGREDSLDLYAIRDDCYPTDPESVGVEGIQNSPRKLHPEFGQAFQTFPGQQQQQQQQQQQPSVSFPQGPYQDYQGYQTLASTSRSQFQPQFQAIPPNNPGFAHYAYGQDPNVMQTNVCSPHQGPSHHVYENSFNQEDPAGSQQQYTNLNSVQPMNAVVQQMGKLEPFSELLAGRYSYYGDVEPSQPLGGYQQHNGAGKIEGEKSPPVISPPVEPVADDCDENFGEIIKKSMVETVSA